MSFLRLCARPSVPLSPICTRPLGGGLAARAWSGVRFASSSAAAGDWKYFTLEQRGSAVWLTLNRPKVHNAFDDSMISELHLAFSKAIDPSTCRSVVLASQGASFSAGADLNWMKKMVAYTEEQNKQDSLQLFDMFASIRNCPVPVIARVNGAALGGGAGLVAACDMAFALSGATLGFTEVHLGIIPAVISRFVMDKIGKANCSQYFLTGERFKADRAKYLGLVSEVYDNEDELDKRIEAVTSIISKTAPSAVSSCKVLIDEVSTMSVMGSRDYVAGQIAAARVSPQGQDGLNAFFDKKPPSYQRTWDTTPVPIPKPSA